MKSKPKPAYPPPHANGKAHRRVMAKLKNSTANQIAQTIVDAGIYTPDGKLTGRALGAPMKPLDLTAINAMIFKALNKKRTPQEVHKILLDKGVPAEMAREALSLLWETGEIYFSADRMLMRGKSNGNDDVAAIDMPSRLEVKRIPDAEGYWARRDCGRTTWHEVVPTDDVGLAVWFPQIGEHIAVSMMSHPVTRWYGPIAVPEYWDCE